MNIPFLALRAHTDAPVPGTLGLSARATLDADGRLALEYRLEGTLEDVILPAPGTLHRGARLWERTCFEAFLKPSGGESYFEWNLSPSGAWALLSFRGYRDGGPCAMDPRAELAQRRHQDRLDLGARLDLAALGLAPGGLRVALSAVLEHPDGGRSFWALSHPKGAPDFHHPESFTLELAPRLPDDGSGRSRS